MHDRSTISVIIPAFNAADTLRETVESVFAQTRQPEEILIVDDGSTDETRDVIAALGNRVESIHLSNSGLPAVPRNQGARRARGTWIAFLDADDLWEPEKLASQIRAADSPDVGLVYSDRWNIGNAQRTTSRQSESVRLLEGDVFEELLAGNFVTTSTAMVRRERFMDVEGFSEDPHLRGVEDWDLWLRISAAGSRFALCPEPLASYRIHEGTVSTSHHRMCRGRLETIRRALETERGRSLPGNVTRSALAGAWACSAWDIAPVDRWRALGWYARSSWHCPGNLDNYKAAVKCLIGRTH